jgi:hypothetical protein
MVYLIKYHAINTFIEPSLKQTQRLQIGLNHTVADEEFVVRNVSYMTGGFYLHLRTQIGVRRRH